MGFGFNHFLQIEVATELSKLISSKFSKNLEKIIIINPSGYVSAVYAIVKPFLNDKVKSYFFSFWGLGGAFTVAFLSSNPSPNP